MSYELAIMALEGLRRSPMTIRVEGEEIVIEGGGEAFKHLARLCLLLGGEHLGDDEAFELQPGMHVSSGSPALRLRLRTE